MTLSFSNTFSLPTPAMIISLNVRMVGKASRTAATLFTFEPKNVGRLLGRTSIAAVRKSLYAE
jgi:hypothetical protein